MTAYDISRLRPVLSITVSIAVSVFAINAIFVVADAAWPNWLPRQFFGADFIVDNRQRGQAVGLQDANRSPGSDAPLIVVAGLSSASEGISLEDLDRRMARDVRIVGLAGGGRNAADLARYVEPLLDTGVRARLAILAVNAFHLMDPPRGSSAFLQNLRRQDTLDDLRGYWLVNRRKDIKYAFDAVVDGWRSALFERLSVAPFDRRDPERELIRMGLPQATLEAQWQDNIRRYGERGYYDALNYERSEAQPRILLDLIEAFGDRGTEVVVVLMPEHSRLRALIPPVAVDRFERQVAERFGDDAPAVVDLRQAVHDDGFKDISHLNEAGRLSFGPIFHRIVLTYLQRANTED